jgi:Na+/H+ antiporter NhaA
LSGRSTLENAIHCENAGGIVPRLCAVTVLGVTNSRWNETGSHLLEFPLITGLKGLQISKSLHHWIYGSLMVLLFLVVGLGFKREILQEQLAEMKHSPLPVVAATGLAMSICIAELWFSHPGRDLLIANTGVTIASVIAGVSGFFWLYSTAYRRSSKQMHM